MLIESEEPLPDPTGSPVELLLENDPLITNLWHVPRSVLRLRIRNCPSLTGLTGRPDGLTHLYLENLPLTDLSDFPGSLTHLCVASCHQPQTLSAPASLNYLSVCTCLSMRTLSWSWHSASLFNLLLIDCPSLVLSALPDSLTEVSITNCLGIAEGECTLRIGKLTIYTS
jgi:hypothetical protein